MKKQNQLSRKWVIPLGLLLACGPMAAQEGLAQGTEDRGYSVNEEGRTQGADPVGDAGRLPQAEAAQNSEGPVRLARFSYVKGNVTWRTDDKAEWSTASVNLPLRQGAQIWVTEGGRAELQFDDGSLIRLGTGAVVTIQTLYSDSDGEFTELKMTDGLATLNLRHDRGVYQVDTPLASVKATGPASIRLGVGDGLELAVKSGKAAIEGAQGKETLQSGDFLDLRDSNSPYTVRSLPRADSWDRWNQERDDYLRRAENAPAHEHLPANIAIVAPDLDEYGSWRDDSRYGWVWCPRVTASDWRPYHDGRWTWVNPFGWTWVSDEFWGWAPYHYGTWVYQSYGWAWCPGPVNQYWSPAVVHFSEYGGQVGWCPLAPAEVRYPSVLAIGFRRGNWSSYYSIGGAAVYYPTASGYCAPRVYNTTYVNRVTYVNNITNVTNVYNNNSASFNRFALSQEAYAANNNTVQSGTRFVPYNSRNAAGVTAASMTGFGGRGTYVAVAKSDTSFFTQGKSVAAPPSGKAPFAGPASVRPTSQAFTPNRSFVSAPGVTSNALTRPVYRTAVQPTIAQNSAPLTPSGRPAPVSQGNFVKPTVGQKYPSGTGRNDRPAFGVGGNDTGVPSGRPTSRVPAETRNNSANPQTRTPVENPSAASGESHRTYNDKPVVTSAKTPGSAAEAASRARESLGYTGRGRPTASGSTGGGSSTERTPSSSQGGVTPSGGTRREQSEPAVKQSAPPRYEPNPSGREQRTRPTEPTTRRDPAPATPPRSETQRNEPTRTEPRFTPPPRTEPQRTEPARTPPPVKEPSPPSSKGNNGNDTKNSDSGSKGSSDSTNRGRRGG